MTLSEINKLGARKYFKDHGVYRNPYVVGTPEYNEFERGWMQSLKRNGGQLVKGTDCLDVMPTRKAGTTQVEIDIAAELYRSRKG